MRVRPLHECSVLPTVVGPCAAPTHHDGPSHSFVVVVGLHFTGKNFVPELFIIVLGGVCVGGSCETARRARGGGRNEQSSASVGTGGIDPMLNAKLTRRKVQQDVELMGNRIERLRAEEHKAKQKVMETKLRGQEILQLQKRNQQAHAAKELSKRLEMEQHTRDQQSQQLRRIEHRAALKSTYETMHAQRREEVKAERRIKAENAEMVAQTRSSERARDFMNSLRNFEKRVKKYC